MSYAQAGKTLIRLGTEYAKRSGSFVSGKSTIIRYVPPPYREPTLKLFKAFEQAATGAGLYSIYDELTGNNAQTLQQRPKKPYKQYKKRFGSFRNNGSRYKYQTDEYCRSCRRRCPGKHNRSR